MKDLKLVGILRTLNPGELKLFEKFIVSPYFSKGRNLQPYFKELKKFYPAFDAPKLTKEYIFSRLYKGATFDYKANSLMNKLNSELTFFTEKFLSVSELEREGYQNEVLLCLSLNRRGLFETALNTISKTEKQLDEDGVDPEYFISKRKLLHIKADALEGKRNMKEYFELPEELSLINAVHTHISYFDEYCSEVIGGVELNKTGKGFTFSETLKEKSFETVLKKIKIRNPRFAVVYEIYYTMYLAYSDILNADKYNNFKIQVFSNLKLFKNSEKHFLLKNLSNLCTISGKRNGIRKTNEFYEIYEMMLNEHAYSYIEDFIDNMTFDHIVINFLELKKLTEAEQFIINFTNKLPLINRDQFVNISYLRLYFEMKEFEKGLTYISKIKKDKMYDISIKQLTVLYFYELGYYEDALAQISSFARFLKESKEISKTNLNRYYGFVSGIKILIDSINNNLHEGVIYKIKKITEKYPALHRKNWLLKKAEELESLSKIKK